MTRQSLVGVLSVSVGVCAAAGGFQAAASEETSTAAAPAGLEEIIVTAQKRSESLNEVGLTVRVLNSTQLVEMNITSTAELAKVTPGLTFAASQDGTPIYTIRGVGFNDYTLGASPAVSVYVDQMSLPFSVLTKGAAIDLERVEVVKGPQGTLYGQNATGGAINFIANKPTEDFQAGFGLSYGTYDTVEADGFISGPLGETLSSRLAIQTTQSGPWQKNNTRNEELGRQDIYRLRWLTEWKPTDDLALTFGVSGWHDESDGQAAQLLGTFLQLPGGSAEIDRRVAALEAAPLAGPNARSADWDSDRKITHDDDFYQLSVRLDYTLPNDLTLTSLTSYNDYSEDYGVDRDGTSLWNSGARARGSVEGFNQELRLASDTDRSHWIVGVTYSSNDIKSSNDFFIGDATNTAILPTPLSWVYQTNTTITQDIEEYGVFGNLEYDLTDKLTLLGGARYTKSENSYTGCMTGDSGLQFLFPALSSALSGIPQTGVTPTTCLNMQADTLELIRTPYQAKLEEDNVPWRVGINYSVTPDIFTYGLIARGFKSGSFPQIPASTTLQWTPVTQEELTSYEVGAKITALQRTLQLNMALFHYDYKDKQVRGIIIDPIFNQLELLVNVPQSEVNGAELEATYQPTDGLTLQGSVTYADSEVKEYTGINNAREFADYSGSPLPFAPEWNAVVSANYRWSINERLNAFTGAQFVYNSATNSTFGDPALLEINELKTLDLQAGLSSADERWKAWLWGKNVTNEYHWNNQFVTQDVVARYASMPATYGISLRYEF